MFEISNYTRNCPCCNRILTYSQKSNRDTAEKLGRKCIFCGKKGRSRESELKIVEETCTKCFQIKPIEQFKFRKDRKRYHTVCKNCDNLRRKTWRKLNPECDKKYYYNNRDKIKIIGQRYYQNNKESVLCRSKKNHQINKVERNKKTNQRYSNKLKSDPVFRLKHNLRRRINSAISDGGYTKRARTVTYLGCEFEVFKIHIESQFESWMSWDNYGGIPTELNQTWDIDHIIPLSTAITEEDVFTLTNYKNLRPLCSYYNRYIKRNKISYNE